VRGAVGTGFAAAVLPVMAQTVVKTDSTGLVAGEVMIPVGDFRMPAYRAAPAGRTGAPVVLVVSEIFGVHEYIADVARRFAKAGYSPSRPSCSCARATPVLRRDRQAHRRGHLQGARRAGHGRPRRHRGLGQGAGRRHLAHRHHRLLLGRPHHLAVHRAQPRREGRRGLVRPPGGPGFAADAETPGGRGRRS
jgi:hypothetical protein